MSFDVNCFEIERINIDRNVYMKMNTSSNMGCLYHAYNGKINSDKGYYGGYYGYFTRYADIYYYNNVFTKGIKKLIKNTSYRYSCLDIVARKHIDIYKYLKKYKNHNEMELFVKNGNFKLIKDIIENNTFPSALENRKNIKYLKDDINITEFKNGYALAIMKNATTICMLDTRYNVSLHTPYTVIEREDINGYRIALNHNYPPSSMYVILDKELKERRGEAGDISVVAMNNKGEWGAATNISGFSFVVATDTQEPIVYLTKNINGQCIHGKASEEWLNEYMQERMKPIIKK